MQIVMKQLSELKPAPYNPRVELQPGDSRYRKLKRSVERFGLVEPLLWNIRSGNLVGGHQRLRILTELQYQEVPVSVVDLPLDQEMALNIVLNNREAQSDWDVQQLTHVLGELSAMPESPLTATGFDPAHLEALQSQWAPKNEEMPVEQKSQGYQMTVCIPADRLETVRQDLDAVIARHQLEVHFRHR